MVLSNLMLRSKTACRLMYEYYIRNPPKVPYCIHVETTNHCNYQCTMCARNTLNRNKGFMDYAMYCLIVDEMKDTQIPYLRLQYYGEPLMHPRLFDMIQYAKDASLRVDFDTNGYLLSEQTSRKILESGLDELVISVHGMTKEDYKKAHNYDAFERVIGNINTLLRLKEEAGKETPAVVVQSAQMEININNFQKILNLFTRPVRHSLVDCGFNPHVHTNDLRVRKYEYFRDIPCHSPFQMLAVSWDGNVTVCCADINFELAAGRIEDGLIGVWRSEKMKKLREMQRQGVYPAICKGCVDPVTYQKNTSL